MVATMTAQFDENGWCWDLEQAPKSYLAKTNYVAARKNRSLTKTVSIYFLAASLDGKTVTRTRWLPDVERFEGFTKSQMPVAWRPYPEHPLRGKAQ